MFSYSSPFLTWTSIILVKVFETDISQNNFKDFFFWKDDMICMHVKKIRRLKTAWSIHGSYMSLIQLYYSHEFIFDLLIHVVNYGWLINHLREKKMHHHIFYWTKFICYWIFYHLFLSILWISCFRMEICIHHFFFLFHFIINI